MEISLSLGEGLVCLDLDLLLGCKMDGALSNLPTHDLLARLSGTVMLWLF